MAQTPTHYPNDSTRNPSTLDYIFGSNNLYHPNANLIRNKNIRFKDYSARVKYPSYKITLKYPTLKLLVNSRMKEIEKDIKQALEMAYFKKYKRNLPKRNNFPLHIRQRYNQLYQLTSLKKYMNDRITLFFEHYETTLDSLNNDLNIQYNTAISIENISDVYKKHWKKKRKWLIKLYKIYNDNSVVNIPIELTTQEQLQGIISIISNLSNMIKNQLEKDRSSWDVEQITKFVERRNDDIKNNNSRMLNSIFERHPRKITLD
ncbi:hypothetical protein C1646_751245 [Rhizophagus diaphanus]|nr:hypothetical protein C1646_751245 [Rhizophagus diaphanus] [Rhizophagus sp. MUCL 43196]